jgi:hypothetical protein
MLEPINISGCNVVNARNSINKHYVNQQIQQAMLEWKKNYIHDDTSDELLYIKLINQFSYRIILEEDHKLIITTEIILREFLPEISSKYKLSIMLRKLEHVGLIKVVIIGRKRLSYWHVSDDFIF